MTPDELARLAEDRRLIFINLLNGLEPHELAEPFRRHPDEILKEFDFALKKARSYRWERAMPVIPAFTLKQARETHNRWELLETLPKLNLAVAPAVSKIHTAPLTADVASEAEMMILSGARGHYSDAERQSLGLPPRKVMEPQ